jgi:hypothetical protein
MPNNSIFYSIFGGRDKWIPQKVFLRFSFGKKNRVVNVYM